MKPDSENLWKKASSGIHLGLRLLIGSVLLVAGFSKLENPLGFLESLFQFEIWRPGTAIVVGTVAPWFELVVGACLLAGVALQSAWILSGALGFAFAYMQWRALRLGLSIDCGCFGSTPDQPHIVSYGTLVRAILMLIGSIAGLGVSLISLPVVDKGKRLTRVDALQPMAPSGALG